jgi:cytochrome c5
MKAQDVDHAHSSPIKTPKQLVVVVLLAFIIPVGAIILLTLLVTSGKSPSADALNPQAVAQRIKPVADVVIAGSEEASAEQAAAAEGGSAGAPTAVASGESVYQQSCAACHGAGVMGAPKFGDKGQWGPHLAKGKDTLYQSALNGIGAMPPKGGNMSLSDEAVKAAVDYMTAAVQ